MHQHIDWYILCIAFEIEIFSNEEVMICEYKAPNLKSLVLKNLFFFALFFFFNVLNVEESNFVSFLEYFFTCLITS